MERYEVNVITAKQRYAYEIDVIDATWRVYIITRNFWMHQQSKKIGEGRSKDAAMAIIRIYTNDPIKDIQIKTIKTGQLR